MTIPERSMPFDEVVAAGERLTAESFLALPLRTRVLGRGRLPWVGKFVS